MNPIFMWKRWITVIKHLSTIFWTHTQKRANENTVSNKYSVQIGWFWVWYMSNIVAMDLLIFFWPLSIQEVKYNFFLSRILKIIIYKMFNKTLKNLIENQKLNSNGEHHIQQYKPTPYHKWKTSKHRRQL